MKFQKAKDRKYALSEGAKEFFRVIILAVIPVAVSMLEQNKWNWKLVGVTAGIAAFRGLDAWVHNSPDTKAKGLSPI